MTIKEALNLHQDAIILLSHVLKRSEVWLYANQNYEIKGPVARRFIGLINKRANHWPVAYLTGHKEFFGLDFKVTPDVLIPRPETELLVELALAKLATSPLPLSRPGEGAGGGRGRNIIDLGTGSGNIIISIAKKLPKYGRLDYRTPRLYAIDSSKKALALAKLNARRHGVANKIKFLQGNLLSSFSPMRRGRLRGGSLIIANLPYLTEKQYRAKPDLHREPRQALVGGKDGLKYFRELFEQLTERHPRIDRGSRLALDRDRGLDSRFRGNDNLVVLLEHDPAQKEKLKKLARQYFPRASIKFYKDLAGRYRAALIEHHKPGLALV